IWTGSDDGYVQLTKDGGANWTNVTPPGLTECLINSIEISPHDPATAYIATTRYKFDDKTPALYKTTNYGKTWTNISKGIPQGAFTRVIREDNQREGLLLAGTETGVYVSWNGGKAWEAFQLNLPITPILDMIIKHGDVIIATSGRSFWILDDLGLLRQHGSDQSSFRVFQPEEAVLAEGRSQLDRNSSNFDGTHPLRGVNPASGVVIYYQLPKMADDDELILEIMDEKRNLINRFTSKKDPSFQAWDGGPSKEPVLMKKTGLNRFVWNMRHQTMPGVPGVYIEGSYRGHKVGPGTYTLNLKSKDNLGATTFKILANPLYPDDLDYGAYHQMMEEMETALTDMHQSIHLLSQKKKQIKNILNQLGEQQKYKAVKDKGMALMAQIDAWDKDMVQRKSKAYDDVENFPNKFTANYLFLINQTESAIPRVNQGSINRRQELDTRWIELKATAQQLIEKEIPSYNRLLWQAGIGAIWGDGS
ncbi:MAG: glycosyl hydrolase, partial [Bacteroidota bacterium]